MQVEVGTIPIRIIAAYAPQENANVEKKKLFWDFIENEIQEADLQNHGIILQMDGNLHAGSTLVRNDPNPQNRNGKIFMDFLSRNKSLVVLNCQEQCEGVITRVRELESRTEKAVLDFCIINEKLKPFFKQMVIDEKREFCLTNTAQLKKNKRLIESDHNSSVINFNIQIESRIMKRQELFNFKNKRCQAAFKEATENNSDLLKCFDNNVSFEQQSKVWKKTLDKVFYKCFKKIRVVSNKQKENEKFQIFRKIKEKKKLEVELFAKDISEEIRAKIEKRIREIEEEIEKEISEEKLEEAIETLRQLGGEEDSIGGDGRKNMWKLLKNKYPKLSIAVPVGKRDRKGNIITNHKSLKHLYLQTYLNRLRNRPIKPNFEEIKQLKLDLFKLRLDISKSKKSEPWELKNLEEAIKHLKSDKARDPDGLINELFKEEVAGNSLKLSLLKLFNGMKQENKIPDFVKMADISTIYKGRGEKCNLKNDRGIFIVSIFRNILMRMIYIDKYSSLDSSISDAQVGGRKGRSVRNHIWVLNAVICDILSKKKKTPVDLQIFDYKECFDSLWLEECMNDMYKGGVQDDKFPLLYNMNKHVNVAVRTPVGKSNRGDITNAIIQGDVIGPMFCGKQVDEIGKECLENNKYNYKYKGEVNIPPLIMIDDLITISECGLQTTIMNS